VRAHERRLDFAQLGVDTVLEGEAADISNPTMEPVGRLRSLDSDHLKRTAARAEMCSCKRCDAVEGRARARLRRCHTGGIDRPTAFVIVLTHVVMDDVWSSSTRKSKTPSP
jgi:hypothetical protein